MKKFNTQLLHLQRNTRQATVEQRVTEPKPMDLRYSQLEEEISRLKKENAELRRNLRKDDLTGLFNAKHLKVKLDELLSKRFQNKEAPALLFLDVDHFKQVNETHGHAAAGDILRQIGSLIHETIRSEDVGFRYGGDEFVLLVSGGEEGAMRAAQRMRTLIEEHSFPVVGLNGPATVKLTVSVGVRVMCEGDSSLAVLEAADRAMYEAKRRSRNACVAA